MALGKMIVSLGLVLVAACGGEKKRASAPASPVPTMTSETTVYSAPTETKPVAPTLSVDEEIARACNLHFDEVVKAPKFEFDRSELLPADLEVLGAIHRCLTTGPLQGRSIKLVGRADPRGAEQYNMALGARRARAVAAFLEQLGVDSSRMDETSRGELDAIGSDEASWQVDRRVDVLLVP